MPDSCSELLISQANDAFRRGDWVGAYAAFRAAIRERETADAYEGLSWAAMWQEDGETAIRSRQGAYRLYRRAGDGLGAARMAMWVAMDYEEFRGEFAVARGWRQRASRLLDGQPVSAETRWLL